MGAEAQIPGDAHADVLAVEADRHLAPVEQLTLESRSQGGLACGCEPCQQDGARLLTEPDGPLGVADLRSLPHERSVGCVVPDRRRADDHARCHGRIGETIHQHERPGRTAAGVGVECQLPVRADDAAPDVVEPEPQRLFVHPGVDVDPVAQATDGAIRQRVGGLQKICAAGLHLSLGHPYDHCVQFVCPLRLVARCHEQVAAADVDLVGERQRHRAARARGVEFAVERHDPLHSRAEPRRQRHDLFAGPDDPRGHRAGVPAKVGIGTADDLHRHAEVLQVDTGSEVGGFEILQQRRPVEPFEVVALVDHVVACQRRHRQEIRLAEVECLGEGPVVLADLAETLVRPAHQVHLVDRRHYVADAQQAGDVAVAFGLGQHAVAGVDQDDDEVAGRRARCHVARVLGVPRSVGDDECASFRGEVAVGNVDGDALLPLSAEPVHEQRQIDIAAC